MMWTYALRYFVIIGVVPRLFIPAFAIAVAAAAARLTRDPAGAVEALTPVLVLQLFAASAGFTVPARRGHFDLLLTSGTPRWQIAIAHCAVSIAPGLLSWLCVAMLEIAASHGTSSVSLAAGTATAFLASSVVAWGTAAYSSRVAGAVGWVLVMTIPPLARVVSPLRILGAVATGPRHVDIVTSCVAAVLALVIAIVWIVRGNTPLEASQ